MLKKITKRTIFMYAILGFFGSFCFGQGDIYSLSADFPYQNDNVSNLQCDGNTDLGNCTSIKEDEGLSSDETIIRRLLGIFGLDTSKGKDLKFIDYLRAIMNMALGLVAFIALIITIYTFYMMIFSENEDGIKKATGNMRGIFIALVIIGLAWLIVSFIFWRYQDNRKNKESELSENITMINNDHNNQIYFSI